MTALRYFMHFFHLVLKTHSHHLPPSLRCSTQSQHRGAAGLLNESRRLPRVLGVHTEVCVCVCAWVCVRRVLIEYYDSSPSQIASACHPLSLWHTLHTHTHTLHTHTQCDIAVVTYRHTNAHMWTHLLYWEPLSLSHRQSLRQE